MKNLLYLFQLTLLIGLVGCGGDDDCEVRDITVEVGDCTCEDSFELIIDFEYIDAPNDLYGLYTRNDELIGFYRLEDLPLTLDNFKVSGLEYEFIKICLDDEEECCKEYEFKTPNCEPHGECSITDLTVDLGECLNDEEYKLLVSFQHQNAGNEFFDLFVRNDQLLGFYELKDLPTMISNFPKSGAEYDFLKVCINDNPDCCQEIEFMGPECNMGCKLFDLVVEARECTSETTYNLELDFEHQNANNDFFDLFTRNDNLIGFFELAALPLALENFELSGRDYDFLKVCINDNPDCCQEIEFRPPNCNEQSECVIPVVEVEVGDCTSANTYNLLLDFEHENADNEFFDVFTRNDNFIGFYELDDLPLTIEDFELSGRDYDFIKVCINDNPDCCKEIEFLPPDC